MLVDFVYADGEQGEYPMCASVLIVVFLTYVLITFPPLDVFDALSYPYILVTTSPCSRPSHSLLLYLAN
jgi:hypothetical protein